MAATALALPKRAMPLPYLAIFVGPWQVQTAKSGTHVAPPWVPRAGVSLAVCLVSLPLGRGGGSAVAFTAVALTAVGALVGGGC